MNWTDLHPFSMLYAVCANLFVLLTHRWVPIIGNHEAEDGDHTHRYLNQTWGEALGQTTNPLKTSTSTASTALAHMLTKGSFLAPGLHGTTPSGTSAYVH